jgi:hypothetical protein
MRIDSAVPNRAIKELIDRYVVGESVDFPNAPQDSDILAGIISHLTTKFCGNVHTKGIVSMTSSGAYSSDPSYAVQTVADPSPDSCFFSQFRDAEQDIPNEPNNYVEYDFGHRSVKPTAYAIQSYNELRGGSHPRSWVVEGQRPNSSEWIRLDEKNDCPDLNGRNKKKLFPVRCEPRLRRIPFRNVGRNWYRHDRLVISTFEIFGQLFDGKLKFQFT